MKLCCWEARSAAGREAAENGATAPQASLVLLNCWKLGALCVLCCHCLAGGVRQAAARWTVLLHGAEPACMRHTPSIHTKGEGRGLGLPSCAVLCGKQEGGNRRANMPVLFHPAGSGSCWALCVVCVPRCKCNSRTGGQTGTEVPLCPACRCCLAQQIVFSLPGRNVGVAGVAAPQCGVSGPIHSRSLPSTYLPAKMAAPGTVSRAQDCRETDLATVAASDWTARTLGTKMDWASLSIAVDRSIGLFAGYPSLFSVSWWRNGPSLCALGPAET